MIFLSILTLIRILLTLLLLLILLLVLLLLLLLLLLKLRKRIKKDEKLSSSTSFSSITPTTLSQNSDFTPSTKSNSISSNSFSGFFPTFISNQTLNQEHRNLIRVFDHAQYNIYLLMKSDPFPRFLNTNTFKELEKKFRREQMRARSNQTSPRLLSQTTPLSLPSTSINSTYTNTPISSSSNIHSQLSR